MADRHEQVPEPGGGGGERKKRKISQNLNTGMYSHVLPRLSAKASVHFVCPSLTDKTTSVGVSGECTDATERLERRARV